MYDSDNDIDSLVARIHAAVAGGDANVGLMDADSEVGSIDLWASIRPALATIAQALTLLNAAIAHGEGHTRRDDDSVEIEAVHRLFAIACALRDHTNLPDNGVNRILAEVLEPFAEQLNNERLSRYYLGAVAELAELVTGSDDAAEADDAIAGGDNIGASPANIAADSPNVNDEQSTTPNNANPADTAD